MKLEERTSGTPCIESRILPHLLVNIGSLSLTSVIMTNNSEVTVNVPSDALMRKLISLVFSRSKFPTTVIFPVEASIENFAAYSLGTKE